MSVTLCLDGFARRIRRLPRTAWKPEVDAQPEACPNGCTRHCREVCSEYARMQWQMAQRRDRIGSTP